MALDVETPDPPRLDDPLDPGDYEALDEPAEWTGDDYRREELAGFLRDGAWQDAFEEWSEHTQLTEAEFEAVVDLGLIPQFDFYWNPAAEDVGYRAPTLPDPLPAPYDDRFDTADRDAVDAELDDLGRVASEVLETDYIHRNGGEFGFFSEE
jgi:hypothetical protein